MADALRDWMIQEIAVGKTESPMEALLLAGWQLMLPRLMLPPETGLVVATQTEIGKYRADFLFRIKDAATGMSQPLVVEVDGHDFHERTKLQAAHDKQRDRWMTENGYALMRFTGSEVYANPFKCASEIADRLHVLRYGESLRNSRARAGFASIRALLGDA